MVLHPGIVSGCNPIRTNTGSFLDQMMKLYIVIAKNAGTRRLASQIRGDKRGNNRLLEILFKIQNIVGNSELYSYPARVPEIVQRAASTVVSPELHGQTDDLLSAFLQQCCGRR